jgi:hypothetical protein
MTNLNSKIFYRQERQVSRGRTVFQGDTPVFQGDTPVLTYAVPVIQTFMVWDAEAQPPSQITNEPPPPTSDPIITSISPTSANQGKKTTVSIYGYDFMSGFTSDFGAGISVTKNTYKTPNWVQAKITISKSATKGTRVVTVTNPNAEFDTYCCFTVT